MSLQNDLSDRHLTAFLNGLIRLEYLRDIGLSELEFRTQIFADSKMEEDAIQQFLTVTKSILAQAAYTNATGSILSSMLEEYELTEEQKNCWLTTWNKHRDAVHAKLVERSVWERESNALKHISWRIDLKTVGKNNVNINEPTAILELGLGSGNERQEEGENDPRQVVLIEMDLESSRQALEQLNALQKAINQMV